METEVKYRQGLRPRFQLSLQVGNDEVRRLRTDSIDCLPVLRNIAEYDLKSKVNIKLIEYHNPN